MDHIVILLAIAVIILPVVGSIELLKSDYFQTKKLSDKSKVLVGIEIFCIIVLTIMCSL